MNKESKKPVRADLNVKELLSDSMLDKVSGGAEEFEENAPTCQLCGKQMVKGWIGNGEQVWVCLDPHLFLT